MPRHASQHHAEPSRHDLGAANRRATFYRPQPSDFIPDIYHAQVVYGRPRHTVRHDDEACIQHIRRHDEETPRIRGSADSRR